MTWLSLWFRVTLLGLGLAAVACRSAHAPISPRPVAEPPEPARVTVLSHQGYREAIGHRLRAMASGGREHLNGDEIGYYMDVLQARLQQVGKTRVSVERQADRIIITLIGSPSFEVGSSRLTNDAEATLTVLARALVDYRMTLVSVHGHTDATGDEAFNLQLSEQRALAVARFLLAKLVSLERLVAVGHGESLPVASDDSAEGREANRRVELYLDPIAW